MTQSGLFFYIWVRVKGGEGDLKRREKGVGVRVRAFNR